MAQENTAVDAQVQELKNILTEDYFALRSKNDKVSTDYGVFTTVSVEELGQRRWTETIECVTKVPDGRYFSWAWEHGLTEEQENEGPAEYNKDFLTEVHPVEEVIVVTKWVKGPAS